MQGTGVPLVTPFTEAGDIDRDAIRELASWVLEKGVDFVVPCGSTSEAELMTLGERALVTELLVEAVPDDVPVIAGTGHPGLEETRIQTERAADAGAEGALVVTPHYYHHDQPTLEAYYRDLAETAPIPIYLYNMPAYTGIHLDPETVARLADHENVHGMKDSSGDLTAFQQYRSATRDGDFDLFVGSGGLYAAALDVGADGGILAVANAVPERASEIYRLHQGSKHDAAREVNERIVDLNEAVTTDHGIPGLKAVMRARDRPAGQPRRPFRDVDSGTAAALERLLRDALP